MFLSIIIPAYNVEAFLSKCVNSCMEQDLTQDDYEIILVNDGSSDRTEKIIRDLVVNHSNMLSISQTNQGLSMARNAGMSSAKGEYIMFVDADDWIAPFCLSKLKNEISKADKPDIVRFKACNTDGVNVYERMDYCKEDKTVCRGAQVWKSNCYIVCSTFNLYKRAFLLEFQLNFMPGVFHEDCEFTPRAFCAATSVLTLDMLVYYVFQNPNSITRTKNPQKSFDLIKIASALSKYMSEGAPVDVYRTLDDYISMLLNTAMYQNVFFEKSECEQLNSFLWEKRGLFVHLHRSSLFKYRLEGWLFKLWPKRCLNIYNIMKYRRV
ncbi:MAG: glycosyltransferase [Paraprevotella sp.]|nr:glycosyltransferase [Paraprevotella sp.]MBP3471883.1 glycosyltransferase [Paraprevotella sp.]